MPRGARANGKGRGAGESVPMQPSDAFFWYAEAATPELRPLVAGLFLLDRAPDPVRCRAAIERLTRIMPRLRQSVVAPPFGIGLPAWRRHAEFDLDYHLRAVNLPAPATQAQLLAFLSETFSTPLDHLRPLWEAHLIGGLEGGRSALFMKLHHAVLDGVGANALFDVMSQAHRGDAVPPAPRPPRPATPQGTAAPLARLWRGSASLAHAAGQALGDPGDTLRQLTRLAQRMGGLAAEIAAASAAPVGQAGSGIGRRLDTVVLSLPRLQRIKGRLGCTLNDLVLTMVSGALGRYQRRHGARVETLTCLVPVNLRRADEHADLGNRVGGFVAQLPVGERDPLARLARIQAQTQTAKRDGRGSATQLLMQAGALIPTAVLRGIVHQMGGRTQLICSNVPGPPAQRYLAGAKIEAVFPFAPVMFGTPLAIALVSYAATFGVGLAADPGLIPDPERLVEYLVLEVDAIEARAARPPRPSASARTA